MLAGVLPEEEGGVRIAILDLETSPNLAHVWSLWKTNVSLAQLQESGQVIAFAYKWHGESRVHFHSDHHDGHEVMVEKAYEVMSAADAVVHYNGKSFDMPWLRTEFARAGKTPPPPHKDIDLCEVVKKQFRFPSNKLDYVTRELLGDQGGKVKHTGHQLWVDCMAGDSKAWALMRRYNRADVVITERLYDRLLPWIPNHPHHGLFVDADAPVCQNCGSADLQRRGEQVTALGRYARYACQTCGKWSRGGRREGGVDVRGTQ